MGLAEGWEEAKSDDGTPYYYNKETKETRWEKPEGKTESKPAVKPAEHHADTTVPHIVATPVSHHVDVDPHKTTTRGPMCSCCLDGGICHCFMFVGHRGRARILANIMTGLVSLLHVILFLFETVVFQDPNTRNLFQAYGDAIYANCDGISAVGGIYYLVFAIGLLWGVVLSMFSFGKHFPRWRGWSGAQGHTPHERLQAFELKCFFLFCATVIGIFGGVRSSLALLFLQGAPSAVTLVTVIVGGPGLENDPENLPAHATDPHAVHH